MKLLLITALLSLYLNASILDLTTFEADFTQSITDDKNKVLIYKGHVIASQPQNATWKYKTPIEKDVYINRYEATIVEPEIEQVVIRRMHNEFDFFKMIKKAKKTSKDNYVTTYNNTKYTITLNKGFVKSISFLDQFENNVKIEFSNQIQNHKIDKKHFIPKYPVDFDIIND